MFKKYINFADNQPNNFFLEGKYATKVQQNEKKACLSANITTLVLPAQQHKLTVETRVAMAHL